MTDVQSQELASFIRSISDLLRSSCRQPKHRCGVLAQTLMCRFFGRQAHSEEADLMRYLWGGSRVLRKVDARLVIYGSPSRVGLHERDWRMRS